MITKTIKSNLVRMMKYYASENFVGRSYRVYFAHGCNCLGAMGSGIAPQIASAFPAVELQDWMLTLSHPNNEQREEYMLGTAHPVVVAPYKLTIFNAYTQFYPGKDLRLEALRTAFRDMNNQISRLEQKLVEGHRGTLIIPLIGAGIAGGDWEEISKIINEETPDIDVIVVEWDGTYE